MFGIVGLHTVIQRYFSDLSILYVQSEVKILGKLSHPNLVKLLGYGWDDKVLFLVYEFMQRGSLENHLSGSSKISMQIGR